MERESEARASRFKRVCVFCGIRQGKKTIYQEAAIELGKVLVLLHIFTSLYPINSHLFPFE